MGCKFEPCIEDADSYLLDWRALQLSLHRGLWLCRAGQCRFVSTPEALQLRQMGSPCPHLNPAQQRDLHLMWRLLCRAPKKGLTLHETISLFTSTSDAAMECQLWSYQARPPSRRMHRPVLLSVVPGTSMLRLMLTVRTYLAASLRAWPPRATGGVLAQSASSSLTCGIFDYLLFK